MDYKDDTAEVVITQIKKSCVLTEDNEKEIKKSVRNIINALEIKQIAEIQKSLMAYQEDYKHKHGKPEIVIAAN